MLWVNRTTSVALIALTILLWQIAGEYPDTGGIFPRVMFSVVAILSVAMFVRSFIPAIAAGGDGEGERLRRTLVRPLAVFAAVAVATAAVETIGFFPAMAALALVLVPMLGVKQRGWYAFATVILLAAVYLVFVIFLNVPLTWRPPGL